MSSLEAVMAKSSMTISSKMNILVQEGGRRLRNHSLETSWNVKLVDLNKLMIQMMWSGHGFKTRECVATRILAKYHSKLKFFWEFGRPVYKSKQPIPLSLTKLIGSGWMELLQHWLYQPH